MAQLLELRDVSIAFTARADRVIVVADRLDIGLREGRMHCVVGRSGSGKTSILRAAAGMLQPTSGTVSWNGERLDGLSDDAIAARRGSHIGYVDQNATMLERLSVLENVLLPSVPRRTARELVPRAQRLLADVGLADLADARPAELTAAERMRAAVARALLLEPPLLILDEPTAGLDKAEADGVLEHLLVLRRNGTALMVASQDQQLVDTADVRTSLG